MAQILDNAMLHDGACTERRPFIKAKQQPSHPCVSLGLEMRFHSQQDFQGRSIPPVALQTTSREGSASFSRLR